MEDSDLGAHAWPLDFAAMAIFLGYILCASLLSGNAIGTLYTTLFYVLVGCFVQFVIGTGLAFCARSRSGDGTFRVLFFLPLIVTPLGVGFAMRMIADVTKGQFENYPGVLGLQDWVWSASPWSARFVMMIWNSNGWIPFIFICMLAALENLPRDHVEAAQVSRINPYFPRGDLAAGCAGGGDRIADPCHRGVQDHGFAEHHDRWWSRVLGQIHDIASVYVWRANDMGSSAAIACLLLILTGGLRPSSIRGPRTDKKDTGMSSARIFDRNNQACSVVQPPAVGKMASGRIVVYSFLAIWSLFVLFRYWVIITSFKDAAAVNQGPSYIPFVDFSNAGCLADQFHR